MRDREVRLSSPRHRRRSDPKSARVFFLLPSASRRQTRVRSVPLFWASTRGAFPVAMRGFSRGVVGGAVPRKSMNSGRSRPPFTRVPRAEPVRTIGEKWWARGKPCACCFVRGPRAPRGLAWRCPTRRECGFGPAKPPMTRWRTKQATRRGLHRWWPPPIGPRAPVASV